jgi:metal-responsive CopG/Arc/MetJ family transcriptional regulator
MVQLSHDLLETLDRAAATRGESRSALIRELLWEGLRDERERELGERIAEGYRQIPQAEPDEWGELAAGAEHSNLDTLWRLEAEERASGHDPW